MANLTSWLPADIEPVRAGVYERLNTSTGIHYYSRWDGIFWRGAGLTPDDALSNDRIGFHPWPWRGRLE